MSNAEGMKPNLTESRRDINSTSHHYTSNSKQFPQVIPGFNYAYAQLFNDWTICYEENTRLSIKDICQWPNGPLKQHFIASKSNKHTTEIYRIKTNIN